MGRVHITRACLTRFVPSPGFLTLLTASSSPIFRALFHARALLEFLPFRAFSTIPEPLGLSAPLLPSCPSPPSCGRPVVVPSSLQIPRYWPPVRRTISAGLQGVIPRVVFGIDFAKFDPRKSSVALLGFGSPPGHSVVARAAPCFHRCSFLELASPGFDEDAAEATGSSSGIAGSSKSSRGHDRSRFRET